MSQTDWLSRKSWHAAISQSTFDLVYYQYLNGRPAWVKVASVSSDGQTLNGYSTYYLQYNWHGDVVTWVPPDGNGSNTITVTTDPWEVNGSERMEYYLRDVIGCPAILNGLSPRRVAFHRSIPLGVR